MDEECQVIEPPYFFSRCAQFVLDHTQWMSLQHMQAHVVIYLQI